MKQVRQALGLAIVVALSDIIAGQLAEALHLTSHWQMLLIAATIAVAIILLSNWLHPFRRFSQLRRRLYGEIAVYEGYWVSKVSSADRPYSVSKIYYSNFTNRWICRGYAISNDYRIVASWKGISIYFDLPSNYWFFKGEWHVHRPGSPLPSGVTQDQFFKIRTNPGNISRLSTTIIDNVDCADEMSAEKPNTEILSSDSHRISMDNFDQSLNFRPKKIEELTRCSEASLKALISVVLANAA